MIKRISDFFYQLSSVGVTLTALLIFVLFSVLVLPGQTALAEEISRGTGSPDTSIIYRPSDLYRMAEAYGEQGRQAYIHARWSFDVGFPLVYAFFLVTSISWLAGHALSPGNLWRRANVLPLVAALFDFLENAATSLVMARYPARTLLVDILAPLFTLLKWVCVLGSFVLLVAGAFAVLWVFIRRARGR